MWNSEHLVTNRVISETIVDHDTSRSDLVHQIVAKMSVKRPSSTPVSATNQCPEDDFSSSDMSSDFEEDACAKSAHPDVETPDTEDSDRLRYKYLSKYQYKGLVGELF